jgi:hypothetical protein
MSNTARPRSRQLALAIALACVGRGNADAITITVNDTSDATSPANCALRSAITAINNAAFAGSNHCSGSSVGSFGSNDTIDFAASVANSTILLQKGQITISKPVTITGGKQTIDAHGASRVLVVSSTVSASDLTLANGTETGSNGSVVSVGSGALTLASVVITGGNGLFQTGTSVGGGSIYLAPGATLTMTDSSITSNSSTQRTAGLYVRGTATITNSTISGNIASCGGQFCAGAAYVDGGTLRLNGCTLNGNQANNTATRSFTTGAIYAYNSIVSVINSTVVGNSASGNDAIAGALQESHGGISTYSGLTLTNSTVTANTASTTNGTATRVAGGVLLSAPPSVTGTLYAANTVLTGNTASGGAAPHPDLGSANAPLVAISFSVLGTALNTAAYNSAGSANQFSDAPGLGPLQFNGGNTKTMALLAGSVAIDHGSNGLAVDAASVPLATDQAGFARIYNGTVDIGALEYPGDHIFGDGFE